MDKGGRTAIDKIKTGSMVLLISLLIVFIAIQVMVAGVRLFYDLKYHRPIRVTSYLLGAELFSGGSPAKLQVDGASWRERKMIEDAYRSIDLPLDEMLDRPVRVVVEDGCEKVAGFGSEDIEAAGYYDPEKDLIVLRSYKGSFPGIGDVEYYRANFTHEFMHLLDCRYLTDAEREKYLEARGLKGLAWDTTSPMTAVDWALSPQEDWAEVTSTLFSSGKMGDPRTRLGAEVDPEGMRMIAREMILE